MEAELEVAAEDAEGDREHAPLRSVAVITITRAWKQEVSSCRCGAAVGRWRHTHTGLPW